MDIKTIKIGVKTHNLLLDIGLKRETFEDIILRLLDFYSRGKK